ncbi:hypothetical protein ACIQNG_36815 [Streptomyces sp. NPDC091377]|uniref:hypothetical protein n=1 Tax=Streptomyces sp. NPDC091377 TaxID=3365995 RepID=UPI00381D7160
MAVRRLSPILVDMHTRRPVDVLADRTAPTFAVWLRGHPGGEGCLPGPCRVLP